MAKKLVSLLLALTLAVVCGAALAETTTTTTTTTTGVAYGVYSNEGEHPDSLIRVTLTLDNGAITAAELDEKLIPVAMGGAAGWAELTDETAALLGDAVIEANDKKYPAQFTLADYTWTGAADEALGVGYTTEINGETVSFMDYVVTPEGGDWYFAQTEAALLNAAGENAVTVEVNTKEGIGHGEDFWPSDLKYSGNIAAIEAYLVANGVDYDLTTAAQDESGVWTVADTTTGATLAGTTNYLRIAQEAYANAQ